MNKGWALRQVCVCVFQVRDVICVALCIREGKKQATD